LCRAPPIRATSGNSIGLLWDTRSRLFLAPAGRRDAVRVPRPLRGAVPQGPQRDRPGVSLHHTLAARSVSGVRDALCTQLRAGSEKLQRYVYVELEDGADLPPIEQLIQNNPLFMDGETLVLPVDSVAAREDEGHGVVLERLGTSAGKAHQRFLLEGRFDFVAVTAQVMIAAARALPTLAPGAHALADLPPAALSREYDEASS